MAKKYLDGFQCLSEVCDAVRTYPVGTTVNVAKGDMLANTSGYATLATSLVAALFGVALSDQNNTAGADGALDVQCILPLPHLRWRVPVEADQLIALADVGLIIDLESEDGVDRSDVTVTANGFLVDEIDVSTDAVAINTYGYAIGRFVSIT